MSVELLLVVSLADDNIAMSRASAIGKLFVAGIEHTRDGLVATRVLQSGDVVVAKEPVVRIRVASRAQERAPIRRSR